MQLLPDGTFRFSPRDLVAYLEGDFAAWCERMHVERDRAASPAVTVSRPGPPPTRPTRKPPSPPGRARTTSSASSARPAQREPGLVEITRDAAADEANTLAAMAVRRPDHLPGPPRRRRLARLPRLPLPLPRQRLPLRRPALQPLGHQARPLRQAPLPGPALRLRRHARGRARLPPRRDRVRAGAGGEAPVPHPRVLLLLPPAPPLVLAVPVALEREPRARPRARPRLGPLGGCRRAPARRVRPPEPRRRHHAGPGAAPGGERGPDPDRAGGVEREVAPAPDLRPGVRPALRPGSAPARTPAVSPSRSGSTGPAIPTTRVAAWRSCRPSATATSSSTWKASPTPSAGSSTCSAP